MAQLQSLSVIANGTTLLSRSYGYDVVGNIQSMTDSTPTSPFGAL
jgi:hypothetical protein